MIKREMSKKLTLEEVRRFSDRPNVKKIDVENVLMNLDISNGVPIIIENLVTDAKLNKWNDDTIVAMLDGIAYWLTEAGGGLKINDLFVNKN